MCVCVRECVCTVSVMTHGSPGAACVGAVAPQVQADIGSSR